MGHISVALVSDLGNRIAGAPISYALRTARDSENFHAGAAAQILFMEPDTACDFHVGGLPPARPSSRTPSSRNATTCTRSGSTPLSRSVQLTGEPDTAGDLLLLAAPAPRARDAQTGLNDGIVGLLTA